MNIAFELNELEESVTPIKVAEALINCNQFDYRDLKELIAYLSVYTRYHNPEDFIGGKHNIFGR